MRAPIVAATLLALASPAAAASGHTFDVAYRHWGVVTSHAAYRSGADYDLRFEGCWAHQSEEAVCGFTIRARRALAVSNLRNASHAGGPAGAVKRTCCLFVQGDERGWPIVAGAEAGGVGVLADTLSPGQTQAVILRIPNYRAAGEVTSITFSRGEGDPGQTFAAQVKELP